MLSGAPMPQPIVQIGMGDRLASPAFGLMDGRRREVRPTARCCHAGALVFTGRQCTSALEASVSVGVAALGP